MPHVDLYASLILHLLYLHLSKPVKTTVDLCWHSVGSSSAQGNSAMTTVLHNQFRKKQENELELTLAANPRFVLVLLAWWQMSIHKYFLHQRERGRSQHGLRKEAAGFMYLVLRTTPSITVRAKFVKHLILDHLIACIDRTCTDTVLSEFTRNSSRACIDLAFANIVSLDPAVQAVPGYPGC